MAVLGALRNVRFIRPGSGDLSKQEQKWGDSTLCVGCKHER